jgi:predicted transcriptional regulator
MDVVWQAGGPVTVRDAMESLNERLSNPVAYTTVLTVMSNMHRKGQLLRTAQGKAHRYSSARSQEESAAADMQRALDSAGDRDAVLLCFAAQLSDEERVALRRAVARVRRQR